MIHLRDSLWADAEVRDITTVVRAAARAEAQQEIMDLPEARAAQEQESTPPALRGSEEYVPIIAKPQIGLRVRVLALLFQSRRHRAISDA